MWTDSSNERKKQHGVVKGRDGNANPDMHYIERKMTHDVGLFKHQSTKKPTIESLLRDYRKNQTKLDLGSRGPNSSRRRPNSRPNSRRKHAEHGDASQAQSHVAGAEASFMSSALKRLQMVEQQNQTLKDQLTEMAQKNNELKDRISSLEVSSAHDKDAANTIYNLRSLLKGYKKQCDHMQTFLSDYGLVWCGYRAGEESNMETGSEGAGSPKNLGHQEVYFNVNTIKRCVADLNNLAAEGQMDMKKEGGIVKFTTRTELLLVIYKDGLFFRNGPLRPYYLKQTQVFIQDISEGYFPAELKDQFPEGVLFKFHDRSKLKYNREQHLKDFCKGLKAYETPEHFLSRIPKKVIKDGQVVEVRQAIAKLLGKKTPAPLSRKNNIKKGDGVEVIETPGVRDAHNTGVPFTTLQLKLPSGKRLLLKLKCQDTIESVRRYVAKSLGNNEINFELRTNFPRRAYTDTSETLQDAGLVPNAAINVRIFQT